MSLQNEKWFQRIMSSEGGLNLKEPASVGGKSYGGISQKAFGDWRRKKCQISDAPSEVEELAGDALGTQHEKRNPFEIPEKLGVRCDVIEAFYNDYFKNARLEILPECLKYIHADFFVNAGFGANKVLQRMVGLTGKDVDGILGPASREKISELKAQIEADLLEDSTADDDAIMSYHQHKLDHYEAIADVNPELYNTNIKGWKKRAQHILSDLGEYFVDEEPTTSAVIDDSDHDAVFEDDESPENDESFIEEVSNRVTKRLLEELPRYIQAALHKK